jgi:hypothetical protein
LPPYQLAHHQVQFGGEIRLARGRGPWMSPHYKQATLREGRQVPADQGAQTAPDPVSQHGLAHRPTHHETHPRWFARRIRPDQQVAGDQVAPGPAATPDGDREISPAPHS